MINCEEIFTIISTKTGSCIKISFVLLYFLKYSFNHFEKSINIIGLNYKDNNDTAIFFLKELNNPYKIILSDKITNAMQLMASLDLA